MKKFVLIDGHHLFHRAFWAIRDLKAPDGTPINAIFGFFSMLLNILMREHPDYISVTLDTKEVTFRKEKYEEYKSTRKEPPDELKSQFPIFHELLKTSHLPIHKYPGFEADDVMATIATILHKKKTIMTLIFTGDIDLLQLVNNTVRVIFPKKGFQEVKIFSSKEVKSTYGLTPEQIVDYKALRGDPSDNLKGVEGIGEKTATALLQKYETLDNIYKNIHSIEKTGVRNKLKKGKESAYYCKSLTKLVRDVPLDFNMDDCRIKAIDFSDLLKKFEELRFFSLIKRLNNFLKTNSPTGGELSKMAKEVFQDGKEAPGKKEHQTSMRF